MLWHVVRLDLGTLDEETRSGIEAELAALADLDVVRGLRVGRDPVHPDLTGLVVALDDEAALEVYRTHPDHTPVVDRITELGVPRAAFDLVTDDDATILA